MLKLVVVVAGTVLGLAACGGRYVADTVRNSFMQNYDCPFGAIDVKRVAADQYRARGCSHEDVFVCENGWCHPASDATATTSSGTAEEQSGGPLQLTLTLERSWITLKAAPATSEAVLATLGSLDTGKADCTLEAMVDGEYTELPRDPGNSRTLRLSRDLMATLATAKQVGFKACEKRWSLSEDQLNQLRRFVDRYEVELGWLGKGRTASSMAGRPPTGGWPAWHALPSLPGAALGDALPATALFEKLTPSVLRVRTTLDEGGDEGSGVAITPALLITNCHVLAGARQVEVTRNSEHWSARLTQSDLKNDRCVLSVTPETLSPIGGVRSYRELKVGEALYTLGAPSGLELSLADGLLSGLREDGGVRYVQTTAPISPGSSGGGLFDSRGNLVGITTAMLAGKQRLNQSLNFAIAADSFWAE